MISFSTTLEIKELIYKENCDFTTSCTGQRAQTLSILGTNVLQDTNWCQFLLSEHVKQSRLIHSVKPVTIYPVATILK